MNVKEAIFKRRTIRKFTQEPVCEDTLIELIDCARVAAYGANMQPLKFRLITDKSERDAIFPYIKWAGYLSDGAPRIGEQPTAYIAVLADTNIRQNGAVECESGAAVTTMMLAAVEAGLATCWLGAIDREKIKDTLKLSDNFKVAYLLALGYGAQESKICAMSDNDVKYYEDENGTIHVPKRALDEIIVKSR